MTKIYMLDTNICFYIMRERPLSVLQHLQDVSQAQNSVVVSVITYYEMLLGATGHNASPRHMPLVESFVGRLSSILPWTPQAAEHATRIRQELAARGMPIGSNDTMIAGHALAADCVLVTNNMREFTRVKELRVEDWVSG